MPDINKQTDQGDLPALDARRILLIGLGSTGAMICNQVLDRIAWTYQSPESVPWLRCMVLETADVTTEQRVRKQARFIHLKVDRASYSHLINNPESYRNSMDFGAWDIPALTGSADAIEDGAKGVRILGRLALMFPQNFTRVSQALTEELAILESLEANVAAKSFNEAQETPVRLNLLPDVSVYIVGTLAGGTASGTFIDMGYLMQSLPGKSRSTTGLFLLPSDSTPTGHSHMLANVYAALVELNHFSSERARYNVQYPTSPGQRWTAPGQGTRPYSTLYLAQVTGGASEDYPRLITACADYVYADLIGRSAFERDARRADILTSFHQRDTEGATQKFLTFGLSSIEFPYARVAKACALRLTRNGFEVLAGGQALTELQFEGLLKREAPLMEREKLEERLLKRPDGQASLHAIIAGLLQSSSDTAIRSEDVLDKIEGELEAAFGQTSTQAHSDLPPMIAPLTAQNNARGAGDELMTSLLKVARTLLTTSGSGLQSLISFLEKAEAKLQAQMSGSELDDQVADARGQMNTTRECVRECRHSKSLGIVRMRDQAVRRYLAEYMTKSQNWINLRLSLTCDPEAQHIYSDSWKQLRAVRLRLQGHPNCLQLEIDSIIAGTKALYEAADQGQSASDGWHRVINGVELFTPIVTVDSEYEACLRETARRRDLPGDFSQWEHTLAQEAVNGYVEEAIKAAFSPATGVTRLDKLSNSSLLAKPSETYLLSLAAPARTSFISLKEKSVLQRLMVQPDRDALVEAAGRRFRLFLDWRPGSRHEDEAKKSYGFIFYRQNDSYAPAFKQMLDNAGLLEGRVNVADTADTHQVLFLQERGAFSLATVGNLQNEPNSDWRNAYVQRDGLALHHARSDVKEWIDWTKSQEALRVSLRGLYLVGISLDIILFESASRYLIKYPKSGPADPGLVAVSNDLDEAIQVLRRRNLQGELIRLISENRNNYGGEAHLLDRFENFIATSGDKFTEGGRRLSAAEIQVYLFSYVSEDQSLRTAWSNKYPNEALNTLLRPDESGREAYYCPHCDRKLGYSPDALYVVKDGRRSTQPQCSYCSKEIAVGGIT